LESLLSFPNKIVFSYIVISRFYFQPLIFQTLNAVIAQIFFSTDTNVSITALGQLDELIEDNVNVQEDSIWRGLGKL
jgi:hypothetical protein